MAAQHMADGLIQLGGLACKISPGPAPLLACVRRELAPINGKHLLADQVHGIADQQHLPEQVDYLLVHGGDEIGNGGEMRSSISGQGHEDHVFPAGLLDLAAGHYPAGVGIEHDLEQDAGIIGWRSALIVTEAGIEDREVQFVINQMIEGVFKGAGQDLAVKMDGDELALGVGVWLVTRHGAIS